MNKDYAEAAKKVEGECHFFFYCNSNSQKEDYYVLMFSFEIQPLKTLEYFYTL